jgi:small subunit ribosomal protein S18
MRINSKMGRGAKGKLGAARKKKDAYLVQRKRICRFCADKTKNIDYKDMKRLEYFITDRGKIVSTRFSGNCARHQRRVAEAIKKARFMSLLPYVR